MEPEITTEEIGTETPATKTEGRTSGTTSTNNKRTGPSIHTLKSDTEDVLTKRKSSVFSIAATVAKKRRSEAPIKNPSRGKNILITIIIILVVVVLGVGGYYYFAVLKTPKIPPEPNTPSSFIPTDAVEVVRIAPNDQGGLLRSIELIGEKQFSTGSLVYVPVRIDFSATSSAFLLGKDVPGLLSLDIPSTFLRTIESQWGIYQMHNLGSVSTALLLSTNEPGKAFAGLLGWEEKVILNLDPLFGTENVVTADFHDLIIRNIDTRIATASTTSFGYGIFGGRVVVLASDEFMLREMIDRLIAGPVRFSD